MVTERPNRKAMRDALDIFRDAMRPFIVRCLKRVRGKTVEGAIREALRNPQRRQFEQNLRRGRGVEDSIDINSFEFLMDYYWEAVFSEEIARGSKVIDAVSLIAEVRNEEAHPGSQDMDSEYVRARLYEISIVLKEINEQGSAKNVEDIRDALITAAAGTEPNSRGVESGRKERPSAVPMADDVSDIASGHVVERNFAGYSFKRVGPIQPYPDKRGGFIENEPETRNLPLHRHGHGPFCRFRVARGWQEGGVYVVASDDKPLYVGECKNLESVWGSYGRITPSAVRKGGNQTYCRINSRILNEVKHGREIALWFRSITDDGRRRECKAELVNNLNPPENRTSPGFPR